jgi:transposase
MTEKRTKKAAPEKEGKPNAPVDSTKTHAKRGEVREKLDEIGIDAICAMFEAGKMQRQIANELGVGDTILLKWIASDEQRSARARESRARGASAWDELALEELQGIPDEASQGQIARAREVASHYRWRASKLGRAEYGEKTEIEHSGSIQTLSDDQVDTRLSALMAKTKGG